MYDPSKWTWQNWLTLGLVLVLLYCLFFGCRVSVEFMETDGGVLSAAEGAVRQVGGAVRQVGGAVEDVARDVVGGQPRVHGVVEDRVPGEEDQAREVGQPNPGMQPYGGEPMGYSGPSNYGML